MEKEIGVIRSGLKALKKELEVQQKRVTAGETDRRDKFVSVMTDFVTVADLGFMEVEEMMKEAQDKVIWIFSVGAQFGVAPSL